MSISTENAKDIRNSMKVFCGISARDEGVNLTVTQSGAAAIDSNISTSIDTEEWDMRVVTDLQGTGFPLDGTAVWYSTGAATEDKGKLGIRSHVGGTLFVTVSASSTIGAVTVEFSRGTGTVTCNGETYEIAEKVIIPVSSTTANFSATSDDITHRVEIASITPGISIDFTSDDLVSCTLDLRSNLSLEPTWEVSSIEIQAYYPYEGNVENVLAQMGSDAQIYYYAGYPGDYSPRRYFYLSDVATVSENILLLTGEDASAKLDASTAESAVMMVSAPTAARQTYNKFVQTIRNAGVKLLSRQAAPEESGTSSVVRAQVYTESSARDLVAEMMNLCRIGTFWLTFVDAGRPTVYWSKPTSKWTIKEEDCGEVSIMPDRKIGKAKTTNSYGLYTKMLRASKATVLDESEVKANTIHSVYFDGWFMNIAVTNARIVSYGIDYVTYTALKDGKCRVTGRRVYAESAQKVVTYGTGKTVEYEPIVYGYSVTVDSGGTHHHLFPYYQSLGTRSNVTGSFTWKGNPKMQPRDVFTFQRLDGTSETCTIESIVMVHEGGGTTAVITYRKGIC